MRCPKCGGYNFDSDDRCLNCGHRIAFDKKSPRWWGSPSLRRAPTAGMSTRDATNIEPAKLRVCCGRKSLRLESVIPSPDYVPNTLRIKCSQKDKTIFDAPLVAGMSEWGILSGSKLLISVQKPLRVEIRNISNLNQGIRLGFLYSGTDDLLVKEA